MDTTPRELPPSRLLACVLVLALCSAPWARAQTAVTYTPTFSATGVNMWGNGGSFGSSTYSYSATWNESGSSGSIDTTWTGDWGARVYGSTSGEVGVNINVFGDTGHVNVSLPYQVTITAPDNISAAGQHSLSIQHQLLAPTPGSSYMESTFASGGFDINAKLRVQATVGVEAAIFKRFGGSLEIINTDTTIPIASFAANTLSIFGSPVADFTNGFTHSLRTPSSPLGVVYPWQKRVGTITVEAPHLAGTSGSSLAITAEQERLLGLGIDLAGLAAAKANLPANPLDLRLSVAGIANVELMLLRTAIGVNFGLRQELELAPTLGVILRSSIPLTYQLPNGTTIETNRLVVTDLSQPISFTKPEGDVAIYPEFFLTTQLENQLGLLVNGFATVEALKAAFALRGLGSVTFGPLFEETNTTPSIYNILHSNNHTITDTTLNQTYIGRSVTNVAPTVGNLEANQVLDLPGLVGQFATSSLAGQLRLSDGGLYNNEVHLTVTPSGALVLANGTGQNANQLSTPGLTNDGYIQVGTGALLQTGTFTNVDANGQLTGGTLEVHGTMKYTGGSIVTNAGNLTVTGSLQNRTSSNAAYGNALATLEANAAGASLRLGTDLNTGRAFTNQGTVALDSTLTTTTFQNGAAATLDVNGNGVLQLTAANGFLNVNSTTGELLGGTYLLSGSIFYQGADGAAGRSITSLGAGTTLVLDGFSSNPRISHWQPDGGSQSDALATLASNHGNFALAGGARQTLAQDFQNHGAMWIDGEQTELTVQGNFTNAAGRTLNVDAGTLAVAGETFDYQFTNHGTLNLTTDGRIEVDGMLGNFSNVDLDARTATLTGGTWNLGGTVAYGTGETAAPNIREIGAGTTLNVLGGSFYNQFHNQDALTYLAINRGSLFLQSQVLKSVEALTNHSTGLITVTGASGWLGFRNTLTNTGTILIGPGATLSSLGTLTYADASNWSNVAADGTLSGIGNLILAGTLEYKGTPITALAANNTLTLAGDDWRFSRRTGTNTSIDGLTLNSVAGSLILADGALFSTAPDQAFTLQSTGNLTLTDDSGLMVESGATLLAKSGATINNDGIILLQHSGATGAQLGAEGTLTLAGSGSIQFTDSTANQLVDSGGTIINSATHMLLGAGEFRAKLINRGLIESFGASGLLLTHSSGANLTNSGVIRANGSFTYPLVNGEPDLSQPTFTPSLLTIRDVTVTNFEGTTAGRIASHGAMLIANATINGGRVEVATGGTLTLDDATLALAEFDVAPLAQLNIAAGHTTLSATTSASTGFGSTLTLVNSGNVNVPTRLELGGGTVFTNGGSIVLTNGAIIDGTGTLANEGAIRHTDANATATLGTNVQNAAAGVIEIDNAATLRVGGDVANAGDIFVGTSGTTNAGTIAFTGNSTLTGGGEIQLGGRVSTTVGDETTHTWAASGRLTAANGATVALTNTDNTISGAGAIEDVSFVNASGGTIRATAPGSTLLIKPDSGGFTNQGLLRAEAGARLEIDTSEGAFTNYANHTLTGGRYEVAGTLAFTGADLHTNAAEITLYSGGQFVNATNGANALANLVTNAATGVLRVSTGTFSTADLFTNHGTLELGEADATNTSSLTAGRLTGNGIIALHGPNTQLTLNGDTGNATYTGNISGSGTLLKSGGATQTFSGNNTFSGGATLAGGTVIAGHNAAFGTGTLTLAGAELRGDGNERTLANAVSVTTNTTIGGNSALTFGGTVTNHTGGDAVITIANTGNTTFALLQVDPTNTQRSVTLNHTHNVTVGGTASSNGELIKLGSGTLTLAGTGAHAGTHVHAGSVTLASDTALGSGTLTMHAGTLEARTAQNASGTVSLAGDTAITGNAALTIAHLRVDADNPTLTVSNAGSTTFSHVLLPHELNRSLSLVNSGAVTLGNLTGNSTSSTLLKSGSGTLTLSGTNAFLGSTTITEGFLQIATAANLGSGLLTLDGGGLRWSGGNGTPGTRIALGANGGTFDTNGHTVLLSNGISGTSTMTKTGSGQLSLHAANAHSGSFDVQQGTLTVYGAPLVTAGGVHLASGATFDVFMTSATIGALSGSGIFSVLDAPVSVGAGGASSTFDGRILTNSSFTKVGDGTLTLTNATSSFTSTIVSGGTLRLGAANILPQSSLTLNYDGALDLNGHSTTFAQLASDFSTTRILLGDATLTLEDFTNNVFNGVISGTGGFTKTGSAELRLGNQHTYTGATSLANGTLELGTNYVLPEASAVSLGQNATLKLIGTTQNIHSLTGGGTIALSSGELEISGNATTTYSGTITGVAGRLEKSGSGSLTLTANNTYTGGTTLSSGTLVLAHDSALGSGQLTLRNGTLATSIAPRTLANTVALDGDVTLAGSHLLTLAGATALSSNSTLSVGASGAVLSGAITDGLGASYGLTKSGAGSLTLSGDNAFDGGVTLTDGTLVAAHDNALGTGTLRIEGGTFQTSGDRTLQNAIELGTNLAVSGSSNVTLAGNIAPIEATAAGIVKTGSGALTLSGANTYTGNTTVSGGQLVIGHSDALGTGTLVVDGGTLRSNHGSHAVANNVELNASTTLTTTTDLALSGEISGTGALTKNGEGDLTLSGASTYSGGTAVSLGVVTVAHDSAFGTGAVNFNGGDLHAGGTGGRTIANDLTFTNHTDIGGTTQLTLSGDIAGAGILLKRDANTLVLTGNNSFNGLLAYGGLVEFGSLANLGSGNIGLQGGGLRWASGTTTDVSSRLGGEIAAGATFDTNGNDVQLSTNFTGTLANGAAFTKAGAGTLTLTGTNTFTGDVRLLDGTLALASDRALNDNRLVAAGGALLAAGAARSHAGNIWLDGNLRVGGAENLTLSGVVADGQRGFGLIKVGSGTLTLSGENFHYGMRLEDGVLIGTNVYAFGNTFIDLAGGELRGAGTLSTVYNRVTLSGNAAIGGTKDLNFIGDISGTNANATLTKTGTHTLTLSGNNTYAGDTRLESGTLVAGSDGAFGTGTLHLAGGTLQGNGSARTLTNAVAISSPSIGFGGTSDLTFTGQLLNQSGSDVTLNFANIASLSFGGAQLSDSATSRTFTIAGSGQIAFTGVVENGGTSTNGALVKTGAGTLALSGNNTYSGGTTLQAGILALGHAHALGTGGLRIEGGELRATGSPVSVANSVLLRNSAVIGGDTALTLSGNFTHDTDGATSRTLTVTNSSMTALAGNVLLSNTAQAGTLALANSGTVLISGVISDGTAAGGGLAKSGAGVLALSGVNTFTGGTTATGGFIQFASLSNFGTGSLTLNGGGVQWAADTNVDVSPRLNALGASGGAFHTNGNDVTLAGAISGTGALTKAGDGILALTGTNTYAGGTHVTGGLVEFGSLANLGSGDLTLNGGGLRWASGSTADLSSRNLSLGAAGGSIDSNGNNISLTNVGGNGGLTKIGAGVLTLSGSNSYSGGTTIAGGTLAIANETAIGGSSAGLTLAGGTLQANASFSRWGNLAVTANGGTLHVATAGHDLQLWGVTSGSGEITKTGDGELSLENISNTFAGTWRIAGGLLDVSDDRALGASAANLVFAGGNLITYGITSSRAIELTSDATFATRGQFNEVILNGPITGTGGLTLNHGLFTLNGTNTYSGGTVVNGTVEFGDAASLGTGDIVVNGILRWGEGNTGDISARLAPLASGYTSLDLNGNEITFASAITRANPATTDHGRLFVSGGGVLTLLGTNTHAQTIVSNSTVAVGHDAALGETGAAVDLTNGAFVRMTDAFTTTRPLYTWNGGVDVVEGVTATWSGRITAGPGGSAGYFLKRGAGTLVIDADNAINVLTVQGGVLRADSADALSGLGVLSIEQGATLETPHERLNLYNGFTGAGTLDFGSSGFGFGYGYQSFFGQLRGSGTITFGGEGSTSLMSAGAIQAPVVINSDSGDNTSPQATVVVQADGVMSAAHAVTINAGARLDLRKTVNSIGTLSGDGRIDLNTFTTERVTSLTINQAADTSFTGTIHGYGHLTKSGQGTLTLAANQQFYGNTAITGGTLSLSAASALGLDTTATLLVNGGTLHASESFSLSGRPVELGAGGGTFAIDALKTVNVGVLSGDGALTKTGSGTLTLTGTQTYTGGTLISSGTLTLSLASVVGDIVNHGLLTTSGNNLVLANHISGTGAFFKGAGNISLTGTNTYTGTTTVQGGILQIGNGGTTGSIVGNVIFTGPNPTLRFNRSDDLTYAGVISSPGGATNISTGEFIPQTGNLSKRGAGTLTLTGANTFTGVTTVEAGTLAIGADAALGTAPTNATAGRLVLNGGALAAFESFALDARRGIMLGANHGELRTFEDKALTYDGIIAGVGALTKSGDGVLALGGANTFSGGIHVNAGTLAIAADTALGNASGAVTFGGGALRATADFTSARNVTLNAGGGAFETAADVTLAWNGNMSGTAGNHLTKLGAGTLILGGTSTYAGDTFVNAGTLRLGIADALSPHTTLHVASGANFDANGFALALGGLSGDGALDTGSAGLAVAPTGTNTFTGQLSGAGGLVLDGPGMLILGNANTFSGGVTLSQGTLRLAAAGALPHSAPVNIAADATLEVAEHSATVGRLEGSGNVALNQASLTVAQNTDSNFTGSIAGDGGLVKTGTGVLALGGTHTYSGETEVTGGELKLTGTVANSAFTVAGGTLSGTGTTGALTIANGGTFAPGNSPGTLHSGNTTWAGGGNYLWEINDATGSAGSDPGWDFANINGVLSLTATAESKFTLQLVSLTLANTAGFAANFNPAENYSFTIASASGGITGFNSSYFAINASGFTNALNGGTWSVAQNGQNVDLVFTAIPEPSTYAALLGLAALALAGWRRTRRR